MTQSLYALGPFRFAVDTAAPDALQRGNDYRWQEQGELSIRPRLSFNGSLVKACGNLPRQGR